MTGRESSCYPDVFVALLNVVSCQTSFVNNWAFFVSYGGRPFPWSIIRNGVFDKIY